MFRSYGFIHKIQYKKYNINKFKPKRKLLIIVI
jgi:hypothetical protein